MDSLRRVPLLQVYYPICSAKPPAYSTHVVGVISEVLVQDVVA
jgi:hypothetical protein